VDGFINMICMEQLALGISVERLMRLIFIAWGVTRECPMLHACVRNPYLAQSMSFMSCAGLNCHSTLATAQTQPAGHVNWRACLFAPQRVLEIGADVACGLMHLHPYIVHRDLKPQVRRIGEPRVGGDQGMGKVYAVNLKPHPPFP